MPQWDRYLVVGDGAEFTYLFCREHYDEGEYLAAWLGHTERPMAELVAACAVHELAHHGETPSPSEGSVD